MRPSTPTGRVFCSGCPFAVRGALLLLLLLHQLSAGSPSPAAVGEHISSETPTPPWPQTGGGGGGGGVERGEEEEEGDFSSVGDRSAQIIKQQDAEEGERWEETAWTPSDAGNKDNNSLCPKPSPPENGYIRGDDYNDGGVVRIFCEAGYTLQGPHQLTCVPVPHIGSPGVWLPQDEYRCTPSEPRLIDIHTLDSGGNQEGPTYTVLNVNLYHTGGRPDGTDKQTSDETVHCPKPTVPQHGGLEGTDYSLYAIVQVTCDQGYNLIGPDHITCLPVPDPFHQVGIWEPQQMPSCQASPPMTLPLILFQELSLDKDTPQQSAHRRTDTLPDTSRVEDLPSLCSLPKVTGPCRAIIHRYYFDVARMECLPFAYGGCHGNDNNFQTFSDCQTTCR